MGYYITLKEVNVSIKNEHHADALRALYALNRFDDMKSGGQWGGPNGTKRQAWYAWMPADLTELKTLKEFLTNVGFEVLQDDTELIITGYDSKTGDEQVFIWAIAPWISLANRTEVFADEPYMFWQGEDGSMWRWEFKDGEIMVQSAIIQWDDEGEYVPRNGQFHLTREMLEDAVKS